MAKGTMKYYFIILGIGIGFTISGIYFMTNPQVEYRYKEYSDEEILERATEIRLEEAKEKVLEEEEIEEENTNNEDEIQGTDEETEEGTEQEIDEEINQENETDTDVDTEQTGNEENIDNTEDTEDIEENREDDVEEIDQQSQENSPSGEGLTEETGQTEEDDTAEYRSVRIYYGDSSETVVHKLYKEGIIQDKKAFNRYVRENNAEKKLLPGVYDLRVDMDYRELLNELMHIVE